MNPLIIWTVLFILLIVIELATISLVSIWFAIGALAGLLANLFGASVGIQITLAVAFSVLSLILSYPYVKKIRSGRISTNVDALVGKKATLIKPIQINDNGLVRLNDVVWTAVSEAEILETDILVTITGIDGNKLIVKR